MPGGGRGQGVSVMRARGSEDLVGSVPRRKIDHVAILDRELAIILGRATNMRGWRGLRNVP